MKKNVIIFSIVVSALLHFSCTTERLNTSPTDRVSGDGMMSSTKTAITALNGVYTRLFVDHWTWTVEGNYHQAFGPQAYSLASDVMGEDLVMKAAGSGWFWYDYLYQVKSRYNSTTWRSYDIWKCFYTIIANVNYIIDAEETMEGPTEDVNYIVGQAYALRAYCYHNLSQWFCRTYKGHESDPGLPLYTEPTFAGTEGAPRGTLQDLYDQILADIDKAVELLADAPAQKHVSHIDYRLANAIKARINLCTEDWNAVLEAAQEAQKSFDGDPAFAIGENDDILGGFNKYDNKNIMWAAEIILAQGTTNPQFLSHMDASGGSTYAQTARKTINILLYNKMSATDVRRAWWNPNDTTAAYQQEKFKFADVPTFMGDRIIMRIEEMVLMEAEALCRLGRDGDAVTALMKLMSKRDPNYTTAKSGTAMGALVTDETGSLLEEIITQRRIELWGEFGRVYDVRRLKQGLVRTTAMGHSQTGVDAFNVLKVNNPETWDWVLTIPQTEFDGNTSLDQTVDQNPMDSGI